MGPNLGHIVEAATDNRAEGWGRLVAGAVALPAQHTVLATDAPPPYPPIPVALGAGGARAASPRSWPMEDRIRLAASRSRPPAFVQKLAAEIDAELVPMGSAGAKIAAVIDGRVDAYVHAGGQYEWDSAAPGRCGDRHGYARFPDRRRYVGIQPAGSSAARLGGVPQGTGPTVARRTGAVLPVEARP